MRLSIVSTAVLLGVATASPLVVPGDVDTDGSGLPRIFKKKPQVAAPAAALPAASGSASAAAAVAPAAQAPALAQAKAPAAAPPRSSKGSLLSAASQYAAPATIQPFASLFPPSLASSPGRQAPGLPQVPGASLQMPQLPQLPQMPQMQPSGSYGPAFAGYPPRQGLGSRLKNAFGRGRPRLGLLPIMGLTLPPSGRLPDVPGGIGPLNPYALRPQSSPAGYLGGINPYAPLSTNPNAAPRTYGTLPPPRESLASRLRGRLGFGFRNPAAYPQPPPVPYSMRFGQALGRLFHRY